MVLCLSFKGKKIPCGGCNFFYYNPVFPFVYDQLWVKLIQLLAILTIDACQIKLSIWSGAMIRNCLIVLLLILVLDVPVAYCKSASLRCGNTFIDTGDSRARVLFKCGEPIQREVIGYIDARENGDLIEYIMEAWTYDTSTARFHIIIFRGNRVYNIESEMK